jgi:hypothetical protein
MKLRQKHWHEEDKNNAIAIAHNAAIAAEKRSHAMWEETAKKLDKQLAAERELSRQAIELLSDQLAAERKKVQPLVDALKGMLDIYEELHARYDLGDCQATVDARSVLAKVK